VIVYYADAMSVFARRLATETYGIPVLSIYGAIEAFHIGFECERNVGYHLNVDLVPVRLVDGEGRDVEEGENGDVIVSNLVNRATVLLNYRLGDMAFFLPGGCACGRTLPLLSFIGGRTDDWIESPSGDALHPMTVRTIFTDEEEIWQFQVEQLAPSHYRVATVVADTADRDQIRARLVEKFVHRIGSGTTIELTFVDAIPRTPGGKVRSVHAMRQPAVQTAKF
jgi:phenylacetate-CoA ligase